MQKKEAEIVIVGGGISGLVTAYSLAKMGVDFQLLEARDRFGGRILSLKSLRAPAFFDLGPSWFWPGQAKMSQLVEELGLSDNIYAQFSQGKALYEPQEGPLQHGVSGISMEGSYRLQGGVSSVVDALVENIQLLGCADRLHLSTPVTQISQMSGSVKVRYRHTDILCRKLVLALPARNAFANIGFNPNISPQRVLELGKVATWMAGHAKVVIEYESPFWRHAGFSGDVISQIGPVSEIHDASSGENRAEEPAFALFGFLGIAPSLRQLYANELPGLILAQLARLFGNQAKEPVNLVIQDWACEAYTASKQDHEILNHHSINSWSTLVEPDWGEALVWSGSETAAGHVNGYLEGAVAAGQATVDMLGI